MPGAVEKITDIVVYGVATLFEGATGTMHEGYMLVEKPSMPVKPGDVGKMYKVNYTNAKGDEIKSKGAIWKLKTFDARGASARLEVKM